MFGIYSVYVVLMLCLWCTCRGAAASEASVSAGDILKNKIKFCGMRTTSFILCGGTLCVNKAIVQVQSLVIFTKHDTFTPFSR